MFLIGSIYFTSWEYHTLSESRMMLFTNTSVPTVERYIASLEGRYISKLNYDKNWINISTERSTLVDMPALSAAELRPQVVLAPRNHPILGYPRALFRRRRWSACRASHNTTQSTTQRVYFAWSHKTPVFIITTRVSFFNCNVTHATREL